MTTTPPTLRTVSMKCSGCPIRHRAVCSYSDPAELSELDAIKFYRDYEKGQSIVSESAATEAVGSIVEGVVALQKTMEDGRRQVVGLLFPSDFIGRAFRRVAPYDAVAVTPVRMCMFRRSQFEATMSRSIGLQRRLLEMTLDELDAARDWMLLLGRKTAREKLASFVLLVARRLAALEQRTVADGETIALPLTRESIAEYLGLTIETVSRQITQMRKEGLISLEDQRIMRLNSVERLAELAGEMPEFDGPSVVNGSV